MKWNVQQMNFSHVKHGIKWYFLCKYDLITIRASYRFWNWARCWFHKVKISIFNITLNQVLADTNSNSKTSKYIQINSGLIDGAILRAKKQTQLSLRSYVMTRVVHAIFNSLKWICIYSYGYVYILSLLINFHRRKGPEPKVPGPSGGENLPVDSK